MKNISSESTNILSDIIYNIPFINNKFLTNLTIYYKNEVDIKHISFENLSKYKYIFNSILDVSFLNTKSFTYIVFNDIIFINVHLPINYKNKVDLGFELRIKCLYFIFNYFLKKCPEINNIIIFGDLNFRFYNNIDQVKYFIESQDELMKKFIDEKNRSKFKLQNLNGKYNSCFFNKCKFT